MNEETKATEQPQDGEELLTIDEAGKFLDTSKSTIYRLLGQGDLKARELASSGAFVNRTLLRISSADPKRYRWMPPHELILTSWSRR